MVSAVQRVQAEALIQQIEYIQASQRSIENNRTKRWDEIPTLIASIEESFSAEFSVSGQSLADDLSDSSSCREENLSVYDPSSNRGCEKRSPSLTVSTTPMRQRQADCYASEHNTNSINSLGSNIGKLRPLHLEQHRGTNCQNLSEYDDYSPYEEVQKLRETVQRCYSALASVTENAALKTRRLELDVATLKHQLASEQATNAQYSVTNQSLRQQLEAAFHHSNVTGDVETCAELISLRQREVTIEKHLNSLLAERGHIAKQNLVLKQFLLLETCAECRCKLPLKVQRAGPEAGLGATELEQQSAMQSPARVVSGVHQPPGPQPVVQQQLNPCGAVQRNNDVVPSAILPVVVRHEPSGASAAPTKGILKNRSVRSMVDASSRDGPGPNQHHIALESESAQQGEGAGRDTSAVPRDHVESISRNVIMEQRASSTKKSVHLGGRIDSASGDRQQPMMVDTAEAGENSGGPTTKPKNWRPRLFGEKRKGSGAFRGFRSLSSRHQHGKEISS